MDSIPRAVPERTWHREKTTANLAKPSAGHVGCKFAERCPYVMEQCNQSQPPLFRTDPQRVVSCFLHAEAQTLQNEGLDAVFVNQ